MPDHVLTLIAAAGEPLAADLADEIRTVLFRLGAEADHPVWLAEGEACDIFFADLNPDQADAAARQIIGDRRIDVVAQGTALRRKSLLLADMESTLIRNEMLDELADYVGLRTEVAAITARAMNGELDFEAAIEARVKLLEGLSIQVLDAAAARIEEMPGARTLVATMRQDGALTVVVSGEFRYFTGIVRGRLGLDREFGNDLLIADGVLTGAVGKPILGRRAKFDTLMRIAAERSLPLAATLAVGDGANDLEMIEAAGLGVAFHAKPFVADQAKFRIEHADLSALLYAQGYARTEFAT